MACSLLWYEQRLWLLWARKFDTVLLEEEGVAPCWLVLVDLGLAFVVEMMFLLE